ncbi:hypothetical protein LWM68_19270 [Niabella sp. W65]|nr:hypothetical protein [Niabella sp. W65]MCH7364708.1 hypothetical protein [Niabella sp. W65]
MFFSRNKDEGIMIYSGSTKNIGKLSVNQKVGEKLDINAMVTYTNQKIEGLSPAEGGNARLGVLQLLLQYRPVAGRNASDDALIDYETDPVDNPEGTPTFQSPVVSARSRLRQRVINTMNANATAQYKLTKNITYRGVIGYTIRDTLRINNSIQKNRLQPSVAGAVWQHRAGKRSTFYLQQHTYLW